MFLEAICVLSVHFGYNDQRPSDMVVDGIQRVLLENKITSPCLQGDDLLCDWRRISYDDEGNFGRLVSGRPVELRLRSSSVTKSDSVNRGAMLPEQTRLSERRRLEFLASFSDSDFVIYVGHSRFGDGPDFSPPILRRDASVSAETYRSRRGASAAQVVRSAGAAHRWRGLDVISCDSRDHFAPLFRGLDRNVGFVNIPVRPEQADGFLRQALQRRIGNCLPN